MNDPKDLTDEQLEAWESFKTSHLPVITEFVNNMIENINLFFERIASVITSFAETYTAMIPESCPICKGADIRNDPEVGYAAFYCAYCDWKNWENSDE